MGRRSIYHTIGFLFVPRLHCVQSHGAFFQSYVLSYSLSGALRHLDTGCTINLKLLLLRIAVNELVIFSHKAAREQAKSTGQLHLI